MACPICFFRDCYQKQLKKQTFGINRFENKLLEYKTKFIEGIRQMDSLSNCSCYSKYGQVEMVVWTDDFLQALKLAETEANSAFDNLLSVYEDFIKISPKKATENLWSYLKRQNLLTQVENQLTYSKLLFRARVKKQLEKNDIPEYFHVPFSKRHLVEGQRFGVSGQPVLYFGSSIFALTKELERELSDLAVAAFLPSYSNYYYSKIFSLTNHINDNIENSLPALFKVGSRLSYGDRFTSPNKTTIKSDIHNTILMNICTFPVETKGAFVAEYVLPQMLTTALLEHGYAGIVFPSTKDFENLNGQHQFSSHHLNLGLFVPYDKEHDTNINLLNTFSTFMLAGDEKFHLTPSDLVQKCDAIGEITKKASRNNNDYIIPIAKLQNQLEYMSDSKIGEVKYFETDIGKLELEFYMKMLCHLEQLVR